MKASLMLNGFAYGSCRFALDLLWICFKFALDLL